MKLSKLKKTWILDLDGTILIHNGYKNGGDVILPGVLDFLEKIKEDFIVIITARDESQQKTTKSFLHKNGIKYDKIIFGAPIGERILLNDEKPGGLITAHAVSLKRDAGLENLGFTIVESL
jgi:hypothetical protein